jgi:hypothetical protein
MIRTCERENTNLKGTDMLATPQINRISLNRLADLWFWGNNVCVPMGQSTVKALPETLDSLGADAITVEYRTVADPKGRKQDRAKFTKRLTSLGPTWTRSEWQNKVVDGFVFPDVMECTISRV